MKSDDKRSFKNYLVKKDLQLRIVLNSSLYMILIVIVTAMVVLFPLITEMVFSENMEVQYQTAQIFLTLVTWLLPAVIVVILLFIAHHIIVTHRICGPLINFSNTLKKVGEGDLTRKVYLRQGDYLKHECDEINGMIDGLSAILNQISEDQKTLISDLEGLTENIESLDTPDKIRTSLNAIKGEARRVSDSLALFTLEEEAQKAAPPQDRE
ncbi:MAG: methyl-accepting chemotaxis protein [Syntrophobacterales bacterium]|jgi:methyl-accepting chemotaxis protein|nr:MAG: methyl-accepting chemotaxis protein [Syntrophobacterales bacterium]